MPDFGDGTPIGCKGKIDFLFVISRLANMRLRQAQLAAAFPKFIETIQSKFADFDYHIMVVAGDDSCKVGEPCCSWYDPGWVGEQCCDLTYPCQDLDLVIASLRVQHGLGPLGRRAFRRRPRCGRTGCALIISSSAALSRTYPAMVAGKDIRRPGVVRAR